MKAIPVIDIFAGPGGLSEGFFSVEEDGERLFDIRFSVECKNEPFETLRLRAFFRQFPPGLVPRDYYRFMRGEIDLDRLYHLWPEQTSNAKKETWQATLGECDQDELDSKIKDGIGGCSNWVLLGGPPCQAYSTYGIVGNRTRLGYSQQADVRFRLYREYIRVLAQHVPAVFVLENVPGILAARSGSGYIIDELLQGLAKPGDFAFREYGLWPEASHYRLFSLTSGLCGIGGDPRAFLVRAEEFGIPQSRHRIIIVGIRDDLDPSGFHTAESTGQTSMQSVLNDMPPIRSALSKERDSDLAWRGVFSGLEDEEWIEELNGAHNGMLKDFILQSGRELSKTLPEWGRGADFIPCEPSPAWNREWYVDTLLGGVCHHQGRPHIRRDLHRYLFSACFGRVVGRSPKLPDFPPSLLPNHRNSNSGSFRDRFRVLMPDRPAGTVISHLSKDGHAFIHPDALQCRSLSPREAARLQTFPDNYYFFGGRASKFHQIGNAVPPLLAKLVGQSIAGLFVQ
jgi:DNA (cytosine-5)-methyltransferase 1